jgi:hypothetical protein
VKTITKMLTVLLLAFLATVLTFAAQQTGGSISGTVKDQSGAIIPNAAITAKNVATGVTDTVRTNSAGAYSFLSLPIGTYNLEARFSGFKDYRKTNIVLNLNDALREDVVLDVGMALKPSKSLPTRLTSIRILRPWGKSSVVAASSISHSPIGATSTSWACSPALIPPRSRLRATSRCQVDAPMQTDFP